MSETWYPKAIRRPITTHEYWNPRPRRVISIVDHITDGLDSRDYLQNADNGSSVTFLVREENGEGVVYQFMPLEWAAWGNGTWSENNPDMPEWVRELLPALRDDKDNINFYTVNIEHERKWPFTTTLPDSMKKATTELHTWLAATLTSIIVDREHIIGHYQVDHIRRPNCPGGPGGKLFPFDDVIAAIKGQAPPPTPTPKPDPDTYTDPITGKSIAHGFLVFWKANPYLGHPLTNEFTYTLEDGNPYTVQLFERGLLQWRMGEAVQTARLGAMWGKLANIS